MGNKLLVWARASVFAALNGFPLVTTGWADIKVGPMLRRENLKRYYFGYFRSISPAELVKLLLFYVTAPRVFEPEVQVSDGASTERLYVFNKIPVYPNYFDDIKDYREQVRHELLRVASRCVIHEAMAVPPPTIGVHVRRSDFVELSPSGASGAQTNIRTPDDHFIKSIQLVRSISGKNLPVTIFTDAYPEEVGRLLELGNVTVSQSRNALLDLILLSRSRVLILSHGSTFGYWAGFMADAPMILPCRLRSSIRAEATNSVYYEGLPEPEPLLVQNVESVPL